MFSDLDETSPSIAAVSAPSVACFMLAVQQQKRLCRQFIDVSYYYYYYIQYYILQVCNTTTYLQYKGVRSVVLVDGRLVSLLVELWYYYYIPVVQRCEVRSSHRRTTGISPGRTAVHGR